jgi:hypothetical protein
VGIFAVKATWLVGLMVSCVSLMVGLLFVFPTEDADAAKKKGCPTGTQKFTNVCIETADRGVGTFGEASADCAADRRRLPSTAELESFRQQPGVTIGQSDTLEGFEWTGNIVSPNVALVLKDDGTNTTSGYSANEAYRCVK